MGYRVLVVDRDAEMCGSVELMLAVLGHQCFCTDDYKATAKMLKRHEPQIVFYEVPVDKPKVMQHLVDLRRRFSERNWLSFLLLNRPHPVAEVRQWMELSVSDGVLMKPFRVSTVVRLVEERIDRMKIVL